MKKIVLLLFLLVGLLAVASVGAADNVTNNVEAVDNVNGEEISVTQVDSIENTVAPSNLSVSDSDDSLNE